MLCFDDMGGEKRKFTAKSYIQTNSTLYLSNVKVMALDPLRIDAIQYKLL